jgi:phospholipid transport system substrate-binding protein|tara:strand:+ start:4156 stop:4779 length:624 start_codon:yes stop_codon:yes gene_type:complete
MKQARVLILILALAINATASAAENIPPTKVIESFHAVLLEVMKEAEKLTAKERYAKLEPAIITAFDLGFMIKVASGTAWRKASVEHKSLLLKAFRRISIATYAFRFNDYSGQRFETLKAREGPRQTKLVHTQIVSPPKKKAKREKVVKLTYVTKNIKGMWKIVDVLLDGGISELAVKHSEYRSTLKTKGAGALASALNKKADQLIAN